MAELLDVLRADPHLAEVPAEDLDALAEAFEVETASSGTVVVRPVEPTGALLLIVEGDVDATGPGEAQRRLGPGAWLGGFAGIEAGGGEVKATAAAEVRIARLPQSAYRTLHEDRPRLRVALALSLGAQLASDFRDVARALAERLRQVRVGAEAAEHEYDVVVIGAGPAAVSYAIWIKQDRPETRIALIEKRAAPGFKIGESTLGPVVRAAMSLGIPAPAMRRLFNNKLGLQFWWMGQDDAELHMHVDHVIEETFQIERRAWETMYLTLARRAGIDVFQGTKVLIDESRIQGQPKELVCETARGDVMRFRAKIVCDASGPAAVIGRHLGIRRKYPGFNTNAYWGYFTKKSEVDLEGWDYPATRHLCFPQGWVWFIELASWERAPDENLQRLVDHVLDIGSADEADYPTRFALAEQFDSALDQWPISIGVVPRSDIDTAAELPVEERFQHYVDRYPVFKRIMDTYDLIEQPYDGHPPFISLMEITQHSDRYAGDGWLLIGDAAYFVNPLYSPGLTYGHSLASFAARETVGALERGDFSQEAFAAHDEAARELFQSLVNECEAWYRAFRHMDAYERILLFRVAFFIGLQHQRILQFGGASALRVMRPMRPMGPPAEPIMNPRYQDVLKRVIDVTRQLEESGADAGRTAAAVQAIIDPMIDEVRAMEGVAQLHLGQAFDVYDDQLNRRPGQPDWDSLVPVWRCARCENNNPAEFDNCYVCGDPPAPGTRRPKPPPPPPGPPGGPPGPPGQGPPGGPPGPGGPPPGR
jgi:flavin-dependent dehydrogenase/CRP-like cAMP-binding protein